MPEIEIIAATKTLQQQPLSVATRKKRVAAYARVSTEQDEQQSSYEAQVDFYTRHIKSNPDWEFVEVFADRGITGTNTKNRENFNRMIDLALNGGEESRSISENVRWGKQKSMRDGKVSLAYSRFLGYKKGANGRPEIVEEEAAIIRKIYDLFLSGKTINEIAAILTNMGVLTPAGRAKWSVSTVRSILSNEKYKGEALTMAIRPASLPDSGMRKSKRRLRKCCKNMATQILKVCRGGHLIFTLTEGRVVKVTL